MEALRFNVYRTVTDTIRNGAPGPQGSILKLFWSEVAQQINETAAELQGPHSQLVQGSPHVIDRGHWQHELLWSRAASIYAGTSEVQRNIIAQRVLGLPRG
jgi:alkylation response protein AidB-like acyl-CoA dehydrogenase